MNLRSAWLLLALPLGAASLAARGGRASGHPAAVARGLEVVSQPGEGLFVALVRRAPSVATELTLTNRGTGDAWLTLVYTPSAGGGGGQAYDVLPSGTQRIVPDAIEYLRALGLASLDGGTHEGTLHVGFASADGAQPYVAVRARVATGADGAFSFPGVPTTELEGSRQYVFGLRDDARDRSSLTLTHAGLAADGDVSLRVSLFSGDPGRPRAETSFDVVLTPGAARRIDDVLDTNGVALASGYASVERVFGSAPFQAYGLLHDRRTGDGSFLPPREPGGGRPRSLTVPVVVGSQAYESELVATNPGDSPATVRLRFICDALAPQGGVAGWTLQLAPFEQRFVPGIVRFLLEKAAPLLAGGSHAGALFAEVDGDADLGVRTATVSPASLGRYGLFYASVPVDRAASGAAWVYGLRQGGGERSNLSVVNLGHESIVLRIELFDGDSGARVASLEPLSLSGGGWWQLSSVLSRQAPGVRHAYARVSRISGEGPFLAYAIRNDGERPGEGTGDGGFLVMDTASAPVLLADTAALAFGDVPVGTSKSLVVNVRNTGAAVLVGSAAITSEDSFEVTPASFEVQPGAVQPLVVRFSPSAGGRSRSGLLLTGDGAVTWIALDGLGAQAPQPSLQLEPEALDFGRVVVGSSRELSLRLSNPGGGALLVRSVAADGSGFAPVGNVERFAVPPGGSRSLAVRFTPAGPGPQSGTLRIESSDPLRPSIAVELSGQGASPTVSELFSDDGTVEAGVFGDRIAVVNRYTPALYPSTLRKLRVFIAPFPGFPDPSGARLTLFAFVDPTGGGAPPAAHENLLKQTVTIPDVPSTGLLLEVDVVDGPSIDSGDLYAGFQAPPGRAQVIFSCDLDGPQARRSFFSEDGGDTYRPLMVLDAGGQRVPANLIVRAVVSNP